MTKKHNEYLWFVNGLFIANVLTLRTPSLMTLTNASELYRHLAVSVKAYAIITSLIAIYTYASKKRQHKTDLKPARNALLFGWGFVLVFSLISIVYFIINH